MPEGYTFYENTLRGERFETGDHVVSFFLETQEAAKGAANGDAVFVQLAYLDADTGVQRAAYFDVNTALSLTDYLMIVVLDDDGNDVAGVLRANEPKQCDDDTPSAQLRADEYARRRFGDSTAPRLARGM